MIFTSFEFWCFLAATFAIYYSVSFSGALQLGVLVLASAIFYAWADPKLLVLLAFVALAASLSSIVIARSTQKSLRVGVLASTIVLLLGLLAFFKYGGLLYETFVGLNRSPQWEHIFLGIPLPIGISFYIFHAISLLVDVARRQYQLPKETSLPGHLARTGLYITFFPQLIAGPIVKARSFFPQITRKSILAIDWKAAVHFLILGYFFKRVLADNLAVETLRMAHPIFEARAGLDLILLMIGYSCQIFADFFGYSLIAMGLACLFGYNLPDNFNRPYIATSFSDFWRRWHMSLSAWLRDYLYVPLGGSRKGGLRTYLNLFIVMFLGGLWHGAEWSYAIWGTLHGVALAVERPFLNTAFFKTKWIVVRALRGAMVFAFVTLAWLFFRLHDYHEAFAYLAAIQRNWYLVTGLSEVGAIAIYCVPVLGYHLLPPTNRAIIAI